METLGGLYHTRNRINKVTSTRTCSMVFLLLFCILGPVRAYEYVSGTDSKGVARKLPVDRYPALYTGDFGDCLGGESLFNVTKFDAGYYADNMTIVFHLDGTSNIKTESLMMYISVEAYGTSRFEMTLDPCKLNIYSMCPLNASVPVAAWAVIPVGPAQVQDIPDIALSIPDFEGSTRLQIFANSSQTEIGCFQAVMKNGKSFSHPEAVAPVVAIFTLVATLASFLTAAYGVSIPHMRMHYAHSMSALLLIETLQTIFFSGMLSVSFPSVLPAWWSNFGWAAGMIYWSKMVDSVGSFAGVSGNASQVGDAGSVTLNNGGGLVGQIYGRTLAKRDRSFNASDPFDYTWAGNPVTPGIPLPGSWSGFSGTLSALRIPAAGAFLIGLIWLVVAMALVALSVVAFKLGMEGLVSMKKVRTDRLAYFRDHWTSYLSLALLRTFFMAFSPVMTLSLFQFASNGGSRPTAIAAISFVVFLVGVTALVASACRARTRLGHFQLTSDEILFHRVKAFGRIPYITAIRSSKVQEQARNMHFIAGVPFIRLQHVNEKSDRATVHQDEEYIKHHGWLSARYRRSRWWFFANYTSYQFVRACFLGSGINRPEAQVYGLLLFEILAFVALILLKPFESARNTALGVWMLSICKILTVGLSIAFLPSFGVGRIITTVLGIVIIIIQGFLVIALLILVSLGAISSSMSLTRNMETFRPEWLEPARICYFENMERKAPDIDQSLDTSSNDKGKEKEEEARSSTEEARFSVKSVHRAPKIHDEASDELADLANAVPRNNNTNSRNPRHSSRTSWSSREVTLWEEEEQHDGSHYAIKPNPENNTAIALRLSTISSTGTASRSRATSVSGSRASSLQRGSLPAAASPRPQTPVRTRPRSNTPSREVLARYAEERMFSGPPPSVNLIPP